MKIAVMGSGYVGLVTGACLAEAGHQVTGVDVNEVKVAALKAGKCPIYEPGLEELFQTVIADGRLKFTTRAEDAVPDADVVFLCVGTPTNSEGRTDLSYVDSAAQAVARNMKGYTAVVLKSTVPVGTNRRVADLIARTTKTDHDVVSNPEFLREGAAVRDFREPDRVVVGVRSARASEVMRRLYDPFLTVGRPLLVMDPESAELVKYAANALLATKISFINEIAGLCEHFGADVRRVREGISFDPRIGPQFLSAGIGFGGSCFPKDLRALVESAEAVGRTARIAEAALTVNERQKHLLGDKILAHFAGDVKGRTIAVWGLAFKPGTDDIREASALTVIGRLLEAGASVQASDPKAVDNVRAHFGDRGDRLKFFQNHYDALQGADALALVTEWQEYREPDWETLITRLRAPVVFDGRNIYDPLEMARLGIAYYGVGVGGRHGTPAGRPAARIVSMTFADKHASQARNGSGPAAGEG
jgi:UDPglucose 6-dehydrogenase